MSAQHTPGPWNVSGNDEDGNVEVWVDGGIPIASVRWMSNARLIAAAPELLHGLKAAATLIRQTFAHPDDVDMQRELQAMDQIIAKAEGRAS